MQLITFNNQLEKDKIKKETKKMLKEIGDLQYKMLAGKKFSILIIFQGLDASGKDGVTRKLLKYCNPVGYSVTSFKKPTPEEYAHDFLWRIHKHTPGKGEIKIFNRSQYEDILVPTVEGFLPASLVEKRYDLINDFEKIISHNDTVILKFFLNVSPDVQKERLMERLELKEKHWKHNDGDWETREKFDKYIAVYKTILERCNVIPWHIVPADENWQKLYYVAKEVLDTLKKMDLKWPELETERFKK